MGIHLYLMTEVVIGSFSERDFIDWAQRGHSVGTKRARQK